MNITATLKDNNTGVSQELPVNNVSIDFDPQFLGLSDRVIEPNKGIHGYDVSFKIEGNFYIGIGQFEDLYRKMSSIVNSMTLGAKHFNLNQ